MTNSKYELILAILTVFSLLLALTLSGCGSCVDDNSVKRAVEKQGYSEVKIKDKHIFMVGYHGCDSNSDAAAYEMKAVNAKGDRVALVVCAGWPFKGVTIRTR